MDIVLHSSDINLMTLWNKVIEDKCVEIDTLEELYDIKSSLIVLDIDAIQSRCKEVIAQLRKKNNKVLVLDRNPNFDVLQDIFSCDADGFGNAIMRRHYYSAAIETIKDNMIWVYPDFSTKLLENTAVPFAKDENEIILEKLSSREQEVAMLLKNGTSYNDIANKFNITNRTVKAHASNIYAKLHIKDKLALALLLK